MDGTKRYAGINLTASRFQLVEVEKTSNQLLITNLAQTFISPSITFEGQAETSLAIQLQTAFDEINIRNPVSSPVVSFTLPPELFITIQLPYDNNLNQNEITEEFRWEISQLFPFIKADELAIKYYELGKNILPGNFNALVVALNKKYLLLLKNFCTKNNFSARLVDNASLSANGFINNYLSSSSLDVINIFNSRNSLTLFINIASRQSYVKVFQKKSEDLIDLFNGEFSLLKDKEGFNKAGKIALITGDEIEAELLSDINQASGLDFKAFNPFEIIKLKAEFQPPGISAEQYYTFTAATGIAARFN